MFMIKVGSASYLAGRHLGFPKIQQLPQISRRLLNAVLDGFRLAKYQMEKKCEDQNAKDIQSGERSVRVS
jgi:hypothetical protein